MEDFAIVIILILCLIIFLIRVPIIIAKKRGITSNELTTIAILSWISIFFGFTWLIALVLSIVWKPDNWVDKKMEKRQQITFENTSHLSYLEQLEKLAKLREKNILTEQEFQVEKERLLNSCK